MLTREQASRHLEKIGGVNMGYGGPNMVIDAYCFGIGEGWLPIVCDLIDELIDLGWDRRLCQVKQKFGGLRFYVGSETSEIREAIIRAEKLAEETCEFCGVDGDKISISGWLLVCCKKCEERLKQNTS